MHDKSKEGSMNKKLDGDISAGVSSKAAEKCTGLQAVKRIAAVCATTLVAALMCGCATGDANRNINIAPPSSSTPGYRPEMNRAGSNPNYHQQEQERMWSQ
jgi:hypothetical protein